MELGTRTGVPVCGVRGAGRSLPAEPSHNNLGQDRCPSQLNHPISAVSSESEGEALCSSHILLGQGFKPDLAGLGLTKSRKKAQKEKSQEPACSGHLINAKPVLLLVLLG
uniref:Uncharacterized protein n=1 Tax=Serinus canaria TaxID=9135 RepID=A0A8C9NBR9_SERCA